MKKKSKFLGLLSGLALSALVGCSSDTDIVEMVTSTEVEEILAKVSSHSLQLDEDFVTLTQEKVEELAKIIVEISEELPRWAEFKSQGSLVQDVEYQAIRNEIIAWCEEMAIWVSQLEVVQGIEAELSDEFRQSLMEMQFPVINTMEEEEILAYFAFVLEEMSEFNDVFYQWVSNHEHEKIVSQIADVSENTEAIKDILHDMVVPDLTAHELDVLFGLEEVCITEEIYLIQSETDKVNYPDMLQVMVANRSDEDIRDLEILVLAWDKNHLPLKLKSSSGLVSDDYPLILRYEDVNLAAGDMFGEDRGFSLDISMNVENFVAIPLTYETFSGESWENPYLDSFLKLYYDVKFSDIEI